MNKKKQFKRDATPIELREKSSLTTTLSRASEMNAKNGQSVDGVVLLDSDRLFREALANTLVNAGHRVIQAASSPEEVSLDVLRESDNTILVTDIDKNEESILAFLKEAKKAQSSLRIVVVTQSDSSSLVDACLKIGVHAYLSKNISCESFLNFLSFVALDERVLPIDVVHSLLSIAQIYPSFLVCPDEALADFSSRERAILAYLTQGASNKVIARHLGIADGTVKVGVKAILRKINAENRTQAAVWAMQHNICGYLPQEGDAVAPKANGSSSTDRDHRPESDPEPAEVFARKKMQFEDVARPIL